MMKTIAVLVYDLMIEYNITVLDGIVSYFADKKDYRLLIAPVNVPKNGKYQFDYQYWTGINLLKSDTVDAIIVISNSFNQFLSYEELGLQLKSFLPKPLFSVSGDLKIPGSKHSIISCEKTYKEVIEHLVNEHGRKKIAYFSAVLTHSPENTLRHDAYKAGLKACGLKYDKNLILDGDFTPGTAEKVIKEKYKSKDEIPFDAIVCANDYTASGCIKGLYALGVKVPSEISVFGFDDTDIALTCFPPLSTINQDIFGSGRFGAETICRCLNNDDIPDEVIQDVKTVYRQSCGCQYENDEIRNKEKFEVITRSAENLIDINSLLGLMNSNSYLNEFFDVLPENMRIAGIEFMSICFYESPIEYHPTDEFEVPENVKLFAFIDNSKKNVENFYDIGGIEFSPKQNLLPEKYSFEMDGSYIILPIFLGSWNYGYLICKIPVNNYNLYAIYLRILTNALVHAYEISKERMQKDMLIRKTQNLNFQSKTDELTQIFNRRGFLEYGQRLMDLSSAMDKDGCVFFFDLDKLKTINDTYGHEIGDLSIRTEARVLKSVFRDSDLIGRLSGDEFAAVAPGFDIEKIDVLRERLKKLNKELSEEVNLPFTLSISVGCVSFTSSNNSLSDLLEMADRQLYVEKKQKHGER